MKRYAVVGPLSVVLSLGSCDLFFPPSADIYFQALEGVASDTDGEFLIHYALGNSGELDAIAVECSVALYDSGQNPMTTTVLTFKGVVSVETDGTTGLCRIHGWTLSGATPASFTVTINYSSDGEVPDALTATERGDFLIF